MRVNVQLDETTAFPFKIRVWAKRRHCSNRTFMGLKHIREINRKVTEKVLFFTYISPSYTVPQ